MDAFKSLPVPDRGAHLSRNLKVIILAVSLLLTSGFAAAQSSACQAPTLKPAPPGANLFNDKQEMELAGVLHRQLEQDMKIVEDEKLTRELQNVGDRLALSLPPSGIKFRYFVVDIPEANAFSLTGGNIYLSRKLIAFLHSEDELAGVIAHEMGHIVAHQGAIEVSRRMKAVLGNSQLHDDDDIEEKYNEMLDSYLKKPGAFRGHDMEDQEQLGADQVAVYALAAAGYDVKTL